ncbi:hypothetical protein SLEP1_g26091 [Rubroshorea leprosula]|uniref:Uncharacterized protein n=1 Tax=Rubroshorea leprosula TaxID=152421 RepID=A0AAV5JYF2_9ROSI|nr:hypothetical protein SLEP1_g26091 [Rubroshorea leprosula]
MFAKNQACTKVHPRFAKNPTWAWVRCEPRTNLAKPACYALLFFPLQPAENPSCCHPFPAAATHFRLKNRISGSALLVRPLLLLGPKFWAFFYRESPANCRWPSPSHSSGSCWIYGSRSFCQLALRSSFRFYASEVSRLW